MLNLEIRKYHIINQITELSNESLLVEIETFIKKIYLQSKVNTEIFKPIRKSLSVQEMVQEQNYLPINRAYFDDLVQNINIEEPIEELLLMD